MLPIHGAAGDPGLLRVLLADWLAGYKDPGALLNAPTANGETPLHFAVLSRNAAAVKCLLACGADPRKCSRDGRTPLHHAGSREVAEMLLDAGADPAARAADGATALDVARAADLAAAAPPGGCEVANDLVEALSSA